MEIATLSKRLFRNGLENAIQVLRGYLQIGETLAKKHHLEMVITSRSKGHAILELSIIFKTGRFVLLFK